jgi:hypothetical protein
MNSRVRPFLYLAPVAFSALAPLGSLAGLGTLVLSGCGGAPAASKAQVSLKKLAPPARPLTQAGVSEAEGGWRVEATSPGSTPLFEVPVDTSEPTMLIYRATLRTEELAAPAYLEMWVRVPGAGEFFSKGLDKKVAGRSEWRTVEIPFFLQKGQRADLVRLNVVFEGPGGALFIRDVEVLKSPLL